MRQKPRGFDERLQHSIDLLQKAEKLAMRYDPQDGFYLAFSGGKDSQALYHVAQMGGVKFKAHMNFTSVDPPQVIRFVRQHYPDVVTHAPRKSIYDLAVERGILPSMRIRWCCADLKEQAGAGKVTLIGIRKQESTRRAKRHEVEVSNKKFSGSLEEFGQWQEQEIQRKEEKLLRRMQREGKKVNEDYFSADKENEVRCIGGKDSILISPIFEWSEQDVWYFLDEVARVPHCKLYDQGYKRIGCILCPMSTYRQKVKEMQDFPHVKRGWIRAIKEIRRGGISRRIYLVEHPSRLELRPQRQPQAQPLEKLPPPNGETKSCNSETGRWQSSGRERYSGSRKSESWERFRRDLQKLPPPARDSSRATIGEGQSEPSTGRWSTSGVGTSTASSTSAHNQHWHLERGFHQAPLRMAA